MSKFLACEVACPLCKAAPGERCKSVKGKRKAAHEARRKALSMWRLHPIDPDKVPGK